MNSFSFSAMLKSAWHILKKHWKLIIPAGIVTFIIRIALQFIQSGTKNHGAVLAVIADLFAILISIIIILGWSQVFLRLIRTNAAGWSDFETDSSVWLRAVKVLLWYIAYVVMWLVIALLPLVVLVGIFGVLIAFIHPVAAHVYVLSIIGAVIGFVEFFCVALYFRIRYQFFHFAVLDYPELSSRQILKKAGMITKGNRMRLLAFDILMVLFNLLGLICIGIGLFATIPISKIAEAKVYEYLKEKHEHSAVVSS